ncbi:MAG TPA: ABC transporter ATP-binding protein [Burkholderiales bacterium]
MSSLTVRRLRKRFGGVNAIEDVSFAVDAATIYAVIGPNGAGKTTLFNVITGIYAADGGEICVGDADVTGCTPEELARRGVSRTFQNLQMCMNMTAIENVMLGAHLHLNQGLLAATLRLAGLRKRDRACREEAAALMEFAGVGRYVKSHASELPYGALKRLEIARALAAKPRLLLLDEPAAGLTGRETAEIDELIQKVAATGVTVLLVEHNMKLVMNIARRILVLNHGRALAEGAASEIRAHPDVVAAYLGARGSGRWVVNA